MKIFSTALEVSAAVREYRRHDETLGFVPTMGALHAGHVSLMKQAKAECNRVAASIFVNPTQFGPKEDLSRYPRPFERDVKMLEDAGVDFLFHPSVEEIYPPGATTFVEVEGVSERLDGKSRPGHFRGVATVVAKLFHIVQPDIAYFGLKDAAQCAVIRRMVRDLKFDLKLAFGETVREADGLALSSRNIYLSPSERQQSLVLYRSLQRVAELVCSGVKDSACLIEEAKKILAAEAGARLDYFEIVDPDTLEAVQTIGARTLVAVAVYVGTTRLIDNIVLELQSLPSNDIHLISKKQT